MLYAIVIHHDEGSSYGVTVPDLQGCFSGGRTMEETFNNARESILLHLDGIMADGGLPPMPQPIEAHMDNENYPGGVWGIVDVDLATLPDKAVRVNITVPSRLLAVIDQWANRESETRSGFLAKAAMEHISARSSQ